MRHLVAAAAAAVAVVVLEIAAISSPVQAFQVRQGSLMILGQQQRLESTADRCCNHQWSEKAMTRRRGTDPLLATDHQDQQPSYSSSLFSSSRFPEVEGSRSSTRRRSMGLWNSVFAAAAAASWLAFTAAAAVAAVPDELADVELVDLPPPYIPAAFAVALLGGVAWLTSSLGNVMDEEASLGLQSGARAKKEMERSRSSYFKKK